MRTVHNALVVAGEPGVIQAQVTADVLYDLDKIQAVQKAILQIYHPRCCSGLNIVYRLAEESFGAEA